MEKKWVEWTPEEDRVYAEERVVFRVTNAILLELEQRGWTKQRLAKELGVGLPHVSRLLSGRREMTLRTLGRIARALDMDVEVRLKKKRPRH